MIEATHAVNPAQRFVVDARLLESGFSCVLQLPTGTGKTWLARQAIQRTLTRGFRAIYLTPIRALADELLEPWQQEFAPYSVGIFTGDYGQDGKDYPVHFGEAQVLIMTPERLDACTRAWRSHWHWIPDVDLVVVDEVHLLGDRHRGARLEGAISRLRRLNPFCRFLCLSATLGNREELADWLDGVEYESTWRPVPLSWRVVRYRKADEKPSLLAETVQRNMESGGRSLVFVQSRRRCEVLSAFLRDQGIRAGYHHAGLTHSARKKAEVSFRSASLDVLVATGTLEMGLNMPVRQVVLYDTQAFDGSQFAPLSVNTVWQRAGRAGRPGQDTQGEAVLMAPQWDRTVDGYARGRFERIMSGLSNPAALAEQIVAEVGSGLCRSQQQLELVFDSSLAAFQRCPLPTQRTLDEMLAAGMLKKVESENEHDFGRIRLAATPLGRIAARQLLQPATVLLVRRFMEAIPDFTRFDLLFALALTPDCEPVLPVDFEELPALAEYLQGTPSHAVARLDRIGDMSPSGKRTLSALKSAALVLAWTQAGAAEPVAKQYGIYPFELVRLRESMERLLLAASAISKVVFGAAQQAPDDEPPPKHQTTQRVDLLRSMVVAGLPPSAATLTLIDGVGPKWARKLQELGFSDLATLAQATLADLDGVPGLSRKRAMAWLLDAKDIGQRAIPSTEDDAPRICTLHLEQTAVDYDPYRMRRAAELSVVRDGDTGFLVSGGLEPHRVFVSEGAWQCDCHDHAKGNTCKHILAVRRFTMEQSLEARPDAGVTDGSAEILDLLSLWSAR